MKVKIRYYVYNYVGAAVPHNRIGATCVKTKLHARIETKRVKETNAKHESLKFTVQWFRKADISNEI